MSVAVLMSYQDMGMAKLQCARGCVCNSMVIDSLWKTKLSIKVCCATSLVNPSFRLVVSRSRLLNMAGYLHALYKRYVSTSELLISRLHAHKSSHAPSSVSIRSALPLMLWKQRDHQWHARHRQIHPRCFVAVGRTAEQGCESPGVDTRVSS